MQATSNYDVVCSYVYERAFQRSNEFNRVTRGVVQGLAMTQSMAETMAMTKMPAVSRNKVFYEKYLAHADNLVQNRQDFFKVWPPAWLRKDCFICADLGCKSKIKADTDKHLENQWRKAKQIVAEVRKDFMPLYANVFTGRLPSGTQLVERMEKLRKAICKIHKARKMKSIPIESDEVKDDDQEEKENEVKQESIRASYFDVVYA